MQANAPIDAGAAKCGSGTPEKKVCTGCGEEKTLDQYAWKSKEQGRRQARCKACIRESENPDLSSAHMERELDQGWNVLRAYRVLVQPIMGAEA